MENFWFWQYFNETIPTNERLDNRIAELITEKGQNYWQESEQHGDQLVAQRNALRVATADPDALLGVDPAQIPPDCSQPGIEGDRLSADYFALKKLRPLGWYPISELGKIWLTPLYKAFTGEDARERLEARERKEWLKHRAKMGYLAHEDLGNGVQSIEPSQSGSSARVPAAACNYIATRSVKPGDKAAVLRNPPMWSPDDQNPYTKEEYEELEDDQKWDYHEQLLGKGALGRYE